jgi:hypothetical protein
MKEYKSRNIRKGIQRKGYGEFEAPGYRAEEG